MQEYAYIVDAEYWLCLSTGHGYAVLQKISTEPEGLVLDQIVDVTDTLWYVVPEYKSIPAVMLNQNSTTQFKKELIEALKEEESFRNFGINFVAYLAERQGVPPNNVMALKFHLLNS